MALGVQQRRPDDAVQGGDGLWKRPQLRYHPTGETYIHMVMCCEDCWEPIPRYVVAPQGFVSPESASKLRSASIAGDHGALSAVEAVPKIVCLPCHHAAFARVYPAGVPVPEINDAVE